MTRAWIHAAQLKIHQWHIQSTNVRVQKKLELSRLKSFYMFLQVTQVKFFWADTVEYFYSFFLELIDRVRIAARQTEKNNKVK